ncbi:transketolase [Ornatilinea apprima]|uniref:Transketolase n=1 Tax=Ornatilinea apprima TaxID=1134406 RepID=A0A0P6XI51_9CHLR|nr:transketolase [Ornatilinea apprima]KPL79793.1 transketolase [Ornatilinea apprima]
MSISEDLKLRAINTIRFLSADGVQNANSGHPGLPMGTAAIAYTIWTRHLRFNPLNPKWANRDRFVLSGGHGSMLLYSLLHLTGFDLPLDELKNFRQWGSRTPGHPEYGHTPGVEVTTGPLGQGLANGVGMAIAESHLAAEFNLHGHNIIDHYTYAIVTDGDLQEGVASEAASWAGHLKLGKLIYLYDDNRISIDGSTDHSFTEDRGARFAAYGWQVLHVADGNDVEEIDQAINQAKQDPRPSLIICRTHIGYGLPTKQDTAAAHGAPPGNEELDNAKRNLGWPVEPRFYIPEDVLAHFREAVTRGDALEQEWNARFEQYAAAAPEKAAELKRRLSGELPQGWEEALKPFAPDAKGTASRQASGAVINQLAEVLPELVGGSADLTPSNNTWIKSSSAYQHDNPAGRYFHFGVREHAMGAAMNGIALHGGLIPYGATFLVFTDYVRPAIRISALSGLQTIWVFTHDSIGLGEDGPTHQPVEHLAAMRAIPGLVTIRPADANETLEAWKVAIRRKNGPTLFALSRQNLPTLDRSVFAKADGLAKGAYVLRDYGQGKPELILMASGSEVSLIIQAAEKLAAEGRSVRVVSMPSWELFKQQDQEYRDSVLLPDVKARLSVEAAVAMGWERWVGLEGKSISIETFGASAPAEKLFEEFGFTVENVIKTAKELLD